ncbi:MAG: GYD domain-containing protein [Dehalococcoidia bacterium]|nr:GYD domain-containing protein [Dehalococcoidia bacterium]
MPQYVVLGNWTDQGIRNIKESPKRVAQVRQAMEAAGGKMLSFYTTMGRYDFVMVAEGPSDEVVAGLALAIGSQGNVRTETLKAFPPDVAESIISRLP